MAVEVDEVDGAEGAPEAGPRLLRGRGGAVEDGAAEVGELGAETGERGREGSAVRGEVAVAPALVVVAAAQLAEFEFRRGGGAGRRVLPLRRHRGGARVCAGE